MYQEVVVLVAWIPDVFFAHLAIVLAQNALLVLELTFQIHVLLALERALNVPIVSMSAQNAWTDMG